MTVKQACVLGSTTPPRRLRKRERDVSPPLDTQVCVLGSTTPPRRPRKRERDVSPPLDPISLECEGWLPPFFTEACDRPAVICATHPTVPWAKAHFCARRWFTAEVQVAYGDWEPYVLPARDRVRRRL